jgi:hypothetical protein
MVRVLLLARFDRFRHHSVVVGGEPDIETESKWSK